MKISIIIPIYNVHNYVERCLDSVICQECEDFDLECILVNDCTPDDSMDVVERKLCAACQGRFRVFSRF